MASDISVGRTRSVWLYPPPYFKTADPMAICFALPITPKGGAEGK